jgi:hypothetical protein
MHDVQGEQLKLQVGNYQHVAFCGTTNTAANWAMSLVDWEDGKLNET